MNKTKKIIISSVLILVICLGGFIGIKGYKFLQEKYHFLRENIVAINDKLDSHIAINNHYDFDYSWIDVQKTVAHGFGAAGATNSKIYSNSLDAFKKNYELGQRVFEVDFDITNDYQTVCSHDEEFWRYNAEIDEDIEFTYENFMNSLIYKRYKPLDYKGIIDLLNEYKDIYIITDTKYFDKDSVYLQFSQLVNYANEVNPEVLDRLVPQIYNEEMFTYVMNIHKFDSIIYTLYQTTWTEKEVAQFCVETGIKYVTINEMYLNEDLANYWNAYGINIAVHTINDVEQAKDFINMGVKIIYTDVILPSELEEQ